jgi:hypothetical protein
VTTTRRRLRLLVASGCLLPALALPSPALAGPPEHARGHGPEVRSERGRGHATLDTPSRRAASTLAASTSVKTTRAVTQDVDVDGTQGPTIQGGGGSVEVAASTRPGRGRGSGAAVGRAHAPGQQKKVQAPASTATSPGVRGGEVAVATPPRDPEPDPAVAPEPEPASSPDTPTPVAAPAVAAPVADVPPVAAPAPPGPVDTAGPAVPAPVDLGRLVWRLDLDGPFRDLLDEVGGTIRRAIPEDLGPIREPLIRVVPVLLAILGAFLALQRGLGRGLGHVPMVGAPSLIDSTRRD